jgi:sulfur carrier protein ThiS
MSDLKDIVIKVFRTGSVGKEVCLNGDRTIEAALKAAGLNQKDTEVIQVNGEEVDDVNDITLEDGDRVVLSKNIEGGC